RAVGVDARARGERRHGSRSLARGQLDAACDWIAVGADRFAGDARGAHRGDRKLEIRHRLAEADRDHLRLAWIRRARIIRRRVPWNIGHRLLHVDLSNHRADDVLAGLHAIYPIPSGIVCTAGEDAVRLDQPSASVEVSNLQRANARAFDWIARLVNDAARDRSVAGKRDIEVVARLGRVEPDRLAAFAGAALAELEADEPGPARENPVAARP